MSPYYINKDDQQIGPISEEELATGVLKGKFSTEDLVWKEGMKDWMPISSAFPTSDKTGSAIPPAIKRTADLPKKKILSHKQTVTLCLIGLAVISYSGIKVFEICQDIKKSSDRALETNSNIKNGWDKKTQKETPSYPMKFNN